MILQALPPMECSRALSFVLTVYFRDHFGRSYACCFAIFPHKPSHPVSVPSRKKREHKKKSTEWFHPQLVPVVGSPCIRAEANLL